ncbi:baseplate J/gp47 family protein [Sunxiuqinia indica]|uniref:baseplate J/gp47 family protein n=1 Tax=Sunxiuqinia indica TaxID=2692584 RepID=UPI00135B7CF1|nr:baseplate J/gp47 family protein [Sunxiuqinia indica]
MKDCKDKIPVLVRDGTSQSDRFPKSLDPSSVKIDGRSESDLIDYALQFAEMLNYYDLENQVDGNWTPFLSQLKTDAKAALSGTMTPQAGLFLTFLRLFQKQQDQLNGLTKKHLDTFFRDVLHIQPKSAKADQVHVLFELAKKVDPTLVKAKTLLKAGKDSEGNELAYQLLEDVVVNHTKVNAIKSILVDPVSNNAVHYGEMVNSADGLEEELPEDDPKWSAFGRTSFPKADVGFALASPVLWLQEGDRTIQVTLILETDELDIPTQALQNAFKIYLSGEEEWLGPYYSTPSLKKVSGQFELVFSINLPATEKPVDYFDSQVLNGNFQTIFPMMKVVPDASSSNYLNAYLQGVTLKSARIHVDVKGIKSLKVRNDQGALDASKAFLPFGANPVQGSSFDVGYPEAFTKRLNEFKIVVDWMDVPSANLNSYYGSSYGGDYSWLNYNLTSNQFKANLSYRNKTGQTSTKTVGLFNSTNNQNRAIYTVSESPLLIALVPQLMLSKQLAVSSSRKISSLFQRKYRLLQGNKLLRKPFPKVQLQTESPDEGFVTFELLDDFLHREYRQKYVKATVQFAQGNTLYLPKEPYQPKIKNISLNYKASSTTVDFSLTDEDSFADKDVEFFQIGAFGQRERHGYLSTQTKVQIGRNTLLADYSQQGQLLVGMKDWSKGQIVNLLIQVADGSANPQKDKEQVTWSVLVEDDWQVLNSDYLLADATNGLLRSGIVKLNLPDEASKDHNWLPDDMVWIRASVKANPDAVCQLINIHAEAGLAELAEPENHPTHLPAPLQAESISKLVKPIGTIKRVSQPYASFGGRSEEKSEAYYTRVSERLRHKNRAITLWDYERLVLQEFPAISKVKCLNHTCDTLERAPGHVSLTVVPDLQNKNAVNVLQPRVSKATLDDVKTFVKRLAPSLIEIHTSNPVYEQVQLEFEVSFIKGYDYGYYRKELNRELMEFLSPWSTGKQAEIYFGGRIEKSVLLKFVETRSYVDFVSHFKMYHNTSSKDVESAIATNARAILVSHAEHLIHNYNS